ncbi:MAG: SAM domain-containing protein [Xanthobacteraceae bacterium]
MKQIADWLEKLGLGQYAQRFAENDIDFNILSDLTDQDLEKIGDCQSQRGRGDHTRSCRCGFATCHTTSGGDCRAPPGHGDVLGPRWFDRTLRSDGS